MVKLENFFFLGRVSWFFWWILKVEKKILMGLILRWKAVGGKVRIEVRKPWSVEIRKCKNLRVTVTFMVRFCFLFRKVAV